MKNIKALFIDCDGVLYDKNQCSSHDMVDIGFGKTFEKYQIPFTEFTHKHIELKQKGIRGVWNAVLDLCNKYHLSFSEFTKNVVNNTDYSLISTDFEMLNLLKKVGTLIPTYIVTNNSAPHLNKIFACLNGGTALQNPQQELNIHSITIENTFYDGIFQSKKMETQLPKLCEQITCQTENVLLLDDTESVRKTAIDQGLKITNTPIEKPEDTKKILREALYFHTKDKPNMSSLFSERNL